MKMKMWELATRRDVSQAERCFKERRRLPTVRYWHGGVSQVHLFSSECSSAAVGGLKRALATATTATLEVVGSLPVAEQTHALMPAATICRSTPNCSTPAY